MKLTATAVIANWINESRTRGFRLQANGELIEISRNSTSEMWSPPTTVGTLYTLIPEFEQLLSELTVPLEQV